VREAPVTARIETLTGFASVGWLANP
jgi:hypothetical protein